ncbi:MAG TPA: hypothetical protein DDZ51_05580 [Planctomycetaceae bacterium]|nr:hypothetical protein [Planctomycetaceae bacterium]
MRRLYQTLPMLAVILITLSGCVAPSKQLAEPRILPPMAAAEVPVANLPVELRPMNWTDARGSGSCVNASTVFNLHWSNQPQLADWWRRNHAGGETSTTIRQHHDRQNLRYFYTLRADPAILDWCTATRRSALIWYYPSHCINFCGFHRDESGREMAYLLDNNRPRNWIKVERAKFIREWAGYGGFALALAAPPVPPPLYDAIDRSRS